MPPYVGGINIARREAASRNTVEAKMVAFGILFLASTVAVALFLSPEH